MSIITLTTDFGSGSPYVAAMKGVLLGINPAAKLVDVCHDVAPQNIRQGAVLLSEATSWFPPETIHIGVVDPGVGTKRRLIYTRIGDQHYLAPDNGLLSLLAKRNRPGKILALTNAEYWLPEVSYTFHGRDILAPVAAQLSLGLEPERLGEAILQIEMFDWPEPQRHEGRIEGEVQWIDCFGNLITNIPAGMFSDKNGGGVRIICGSKVIGGIVRSYGECKRGQLVALIGSNGFLEVAIVDGSAAGELHVGVGAPIIVEWS